MGHLSALAGGGPPGEDRALHQGAGSGARLLTNLVTTVKEPQENADVRQPSRVRGAPGRPGTDETNPKRQELNVVQQRRKAMDDRMNYELEMERAMQDMRQGRAPGFRGLGGRMAGAAQAAQQFTNANQ